MRLKKLLDQYPIFLENHNYSESEIIELLQSNFYPGSRGPRLNKSNFHDQSVGGLSFSIDNRADESFSFQIAKIYQKKHPHKAGV